MSNARDVVLHVDDVKVVNANVGFVNKSAGSQYRVFIDISGPLDSPQTSTWQVLARLVQNAFFKAILPGLEREAGPSRSGRG